MFVLHLVHRVLLKMLMEYVKCVIKESICKAVRFVVMNRNALLVSITLICKKTYVLRALLVSMLLFLLL